MLAMVMHEQRIGHSIVFRSSHLQCASLTSHSAGIMDGHVFHIFTHENIPKSKHGSFFKKCTGEPLNLVKSIFGKTLPKAHTHKQTHHDSGVGPVSCGRQIDSDRDWPRGIFEPFFMRTKLLHAGPAIQCWKAASSQLGSKVACKAVAARKISNEWTTLPTCFHPQSTKTTSLPWGRCGKRMAIKQENYIGIETAVG